MNATKTRKENDAVGTLLQLIERIGIATGHKDISLHGLNVFVTAAQADLKGEPLESKEIAAKVGISTSAVSRQVAALGDWHASQKPGLGLLTAIPDLADRRRKPVKLTTRGRKALDSILKEL